MDIYDADGNRRDLSWLQNKYGPVEVVVMAGGAWHVSELREKVNCEATQIVITHDENGEPLGGVEVAFYWPDAPVDPAGGGLGRCVHGPTEGAAAAVGFGFGQGAFYFPPNQGPHAVWVYGGSSDLVRGLGMLGQTNHDHINVTYQRGEPEPPKPPVDDFEAQVIDRLDMIIDLLQLERRIVIA